MLEQIKHYEDKLKYEIDSWDLYTAIQNKENIVVLDVRKKEAFDKEYIIGAQNFPHKTMNEESTKNLSKDVLYICYCDGIGCNGSTKGSLNMAKLGFNVKELLGGLDWWKRDGYETSLQKQSGINCGC